MERRDNEKKMLEIDLEKGTCDLLVKNPNKLEKCDSIMVGKMLCPLVGRKVVGKVYSINTVVNNFDKIEAFGSESMRRDAKTKSEVNQGTWAKHLNEFKHATMMKEKVQEIRGKCLFAGMTSILVKNNGGKLEAGLFAEKRQWQGGHKFNNARTGYMVPWRIFPSQE